ncbi:MAG: HDIG domain-containing protein, partial [Nitrospirae bacterium]|nr:HDIG domain-containing protein [Nitrospirota bacterium]
PVVIGPMLAAILFDIHIAIVFSFINSLLMGMLIREEQFYILFSFIGGIVAAFSVIQCKKRSALQKAGLFVGLINILIIIAINFYNAAIFTVRGPLDIAFGVTGGFIASTITAGLLSLLEAPFKITTNFKLLELLDLNQPILRQLFVVAPGTYHHSMVVSTLSESAAEAVKLNPLLTRVAAYYHDIGKITKPEYFIENQMGSVNRHDRLTPSMSSLILISHVKDGIELAKEHGLPKEIIDIIQQHHGTRITTFFYKKALDCHNPALPPVNEMDFRYHGPKPQTKIAAIIMLADAVEAASRLLIEPTPSRISNLVEKIVKDIFIDEQLNECDLTLKDLSAIKESFTKVLSGIFHHRIDYPGMKISDYGEADEDTDKKQTEKDKGKLREIRRIGQKGSHGAGTY